MNIDNQKIFSKFIVPDIPTAVEIEVGLAILEWSKKELAHYSGIDISSVNRMMLMLGSKGLLRVRAKVVRTINQALLNKTRKDS